MQVPSWDPARYRAVDPHALAKWSEREWCHGCKALVFTWRGPWTLHRDACTARRHRAAASEEP